MDRSTELGVRYWQSSKCVCGHMCGGGALGEVAWCCVGEMGIGRLLVK